MLTKPFHHSQTETLPFGEYPDCTYGELALTIEPNRELLGKILSFGQYLEVISPQSLREQIREILNVQIVQYTDDKL